MGADLPGDGATGIAQSVAWQPLPQEKCEGCGRLTPGWYEKRNDHIADSLGDVSSRKLAAAYGMSEVRVREIAVEVLGRRAYIERVMKSEGWEFETSP